MRPLDLKYLDALLSPLRNGQLAIFSASCASRLLPVYDSFFQRTRIGNPELLQRSLERVWESVSGKIPIDAQQENWLLELENLIPKEIDRTPLLEYAADATLAVKCAVRSLLYEDFQDASWAAQCVQESVARFLQNTHDFRNKQGTTFVDELATYGLMQTECTRQERDIEELLKIEMPIPKDGVNVFRSRAKQEVALPDLKPDFEPLYKKW
jgi:uncharacterized protein YjaG (DUF416 family)